MPRFSLSPSSSSRRSPAAAPNLSYAHRPELEGKYRAPPSDDDTDSEVSSSSDSYSDATPASLTDDDESEACYSGSDGEEDMEDEEPHPLGFPKSYGRTRFVLDPTTTNFAVAEEKKTDRDYGDDTWFAPLHPDGCGWVSVPEQTVPPLGARATRAGGTAALLAHDRRRRRGRSDDAAAAGSVDELTSGMGRIASLVRAAASLGPEEGEGGGENSSSELAMLSAPANALAMRRCTNGLWELAEAAQHRSAVIAGTISADRARIERDQQRAASILRSLIDRDQKIADAVVKRERVERDRAERAERERVQAQRDEEKRLVRLEEERARQVERQRREKAEADESARLARIADDELRQKQKDEVKARIHAERAKKTEYVGKADRLVAKLVEVRNSLQPFESNRAVSKRRLQFKKVVRGRLNTLSHDVEKVRAVAGDVVQAINAARAEDEQIKERLQAGAGQAEGLTPDMARGKRYLLDLLSSNVIVRVQAEGFNGTRGDGFPLAAALSLTSTEAKELVPLLAAHIYTACPAAIPKLPDLAEGCTETELMEGLGMAKDKNGEYETFERFLTRTEGLISITADIMSSIPPEHSLMGGHKGALDWLGRFLDLLPPAPQEPLPLLTAPVLVAFLTGAGHMLANKFPDEFRAYLGTIADDVAKRVDVGTIGQPSATRLKKVLEGGFEGFRSTMPPGAVEALYDGAGGGGGAGGTSLLHPSQPSVAPGLSGTASSSRSSTFGSAGSGLGGGGARPFGAAAAAGSVPSPFGPPPQPMQQQQQAGPSSFGMGSQQQQSPFGAPPGEGGGGSNKPPCKFFAQGQCRNGDSCQFSHDLPGNRGGGDGSISGGGGGGSNRPPCSFFANGQCRNGDSCKFSHDLPGGDNTGNAPGAPGASSQAATPFGGGLIADAGGGMSGSSPFSGPTQGQPQQGAAQSPFGGGIPSQQQQQQQQKQGFGASSPFGIAAPAPSPFGGGAAAAPSPFGGVAAAAPSPFGSGTAAAAAPSPSPFGGGAQGGGGASNPFGGGRGAPSSAQLPDPFGGASAAAPNPSPFGGGKPGAQQSPFGGGGGTNFGSGVNNNPFGSSSFGGGGSGTGGSKPPCKFFAQGRCRNGANCKFSHDLPGGSAPPPGGGANQSFGSFGGGGGGGGGGGANNPFGGGGVNNPFGGGGRCGAGFGNPFGVPRR